MKRCVIFTAYHQPGALPVFSPRAEDLLLCADGGYALCKEMCITPHRVLGDCDSIARADIPAELLVTYPAEKDDTDTMLCIRYALEQSCDECLLFGGIGGRLDHTLANLQSLAFAHTHGMRAGMVDACDQAFLMENEERIISYQKNTAISLLAYTERCAGVTISGVKYPLLHATLTQNFPLGVSNRCTAEYARVAVEEGILLVVLSSVG